MSTLIVRYGLKETGSDGISAAGIFEIEISIAENAVRAPGSTHPIDMRLITQALVFAQRYKRLAVYRTTDGRTVAINPDHVISIEEPPRT